MPVDLEPGSVDWWLTRLERGLNARRADLEKYQDYYAGKHKLSFATEKFRVAFKGLFEEFSDNWCDLVVDAVEERTNVEGFRIPPTSEDDDADPQEGDSETWEIWQRNQLDADSQIAHTETLINGEASVLVWADDDGEPEITIEHPLEMIVDYMPGGRGAVAAALKLWTDGTRKYATLYLPDGIYKFQSRGMRATRRGSRWEERHVEDEEWPLDNPLGVVPVVPLFNKPRLLAGPESELRKVIPLQDAANKLVCDLLIASEFASFRQRWATGLEIPRDPETNQPIFDSYRQAIDRFWLIEQPKDEVQVGEFGEANLTHIVSAVELIVQHIASQTRTPPHYFYLRGQFPSGESIKSAETGLVAKARRKMRFWGESWESVMRLAWKVKDDPRAEVVGMETIWGDPEYRTEGEHVDATVKKVQSLGVPIEQGWEDIGYTPQQIARMKRMAAEGDLTAMIALSKFNVDAPAPANGPRPAPVPAG